MQQQFGRLTQLNKQFESEDCPSTGKIKERLQHKHLAFKFQQDSDKRTMVIGHRGGSPGPENSLYGFQWAIDNDLEAIEFDVSNLELAFFYSLTLSLIQQVWLSKDNTPMVLHGGDDGELSHYGLGNEFVYSWTKLELQSRIDIGEGQRIPTLESVLCLCQDNPNMLLNIELKGPCDSELLQQYDSDLAALKVVQLIDQYDIANKVMISSFTPVILESIVTNSPSTRQFIILQLTDEDRADYPTHDSHTGVSLQQDFLT